MTFGLRGVSVRRGGVLALQDVDIVLPPGEVRVVVGGDGAGKTTLLSTLAGALRPMEGEVLRPEARRIGYLPAASGVYPDLSVAENLAFAAAAYGSRGAQARERRRMLLARAGLAGVEQRLGAQLSGGMRQKLGVIRAMLHHPDLLILDEPTTGVDPVSRRELWWLIAHAAAEGSAVVVATTYVDEAERAAELLLLDHGRTLGSGTPQAVAAAMPGRLYAGDDPPRGDAVDRAWRRGRPWRLWCPDEQAPGKGWREVRADLQDAVTVALLRWELSRRGGAA
jgi:ABC-2 type transport system ATP-binding protein